jgi:hypothetical protein
MAFDFKEFTEEVTAQIEKMSDSCHKKIAQRDDRIVALEKQLHDLAAGRMGGVPSIREMLASHKGLIDRPVPMEQGRAHSITIPAKDILGVSRGFPESIPIVAGGPRVPLGVQNLIPSSPTTAGAVQFLRETSFTNAAAPVAEGAAKPKSDKVFTPVVLPIEVIAHFFKISRQSWEDLNQVATQIESNGIYGLNVRVDQQLLKGTGVAPELGPGLYLVATAAAPPPVTVNSPNLIDRIFLAAAQLRAAGWNPSGAVLNATDYAGMLIAKDDNGQYIYNTSVPLPQIVTSPALAEGEWLVGDFSQAFIFMRADASISVASQNEDDFIKNMYTALAETRLALAVYQPSAFIKNGVGTI